MFTRSLHNLISTISIAYERLMPALTIDLCTNCCGGDGLALCLYSFIKSFLTRLRKWPQYPELCYKTPLSSINAARCIFQLTFSLSEIRQVVASARKSLQWLWLKPWLHSQLAHTHSIIHTLVTNMYRFTTRYKQLQFSQSNRIACDILHYNAFSCY